MLFLPMRVSGVAEKRSYLFIITWKATEKPGTSLIVQHASLFSVLKRHIVSLTHENIYEENTSIYSLF